MRFENDEGIAHPLVTEMEPGTYSWCRCGHTHTVPYCDGSHEGSDVTPLAFTVGTRETMAVCSCGMTHTPPFCDGSHSAIE